MEKYRVSEGALKNNFNYMCVAEVEGSVLFGYGENAVSYLNPFISQT